MMDVLTAKILEKLRDHEGADCTGDGGCYSGELAGEAADKIEALYAVTEERIGAEHYGPYGRACMNTGQFDAGECWLCYAKRKKKESVELKKQGAGLEKTIRKLEASLVRLNGVAKGLQTHTGVLRARVIDSKQKLLDMTAKAGEMQLVAGRYQYQFEHAMKAINAIDDLFEYAYKAMEHDTLQKLVRDHLATFTKAVKPKGK